MCKHSVEQHPEFKHSFMAIEIKNKLLWEPPLSRLAGTCENSPGYLKVIIIEKLMFMSHTDQNWTHHQRS